jgi:hypothetical protein
MLQLLAGRQTWQGELHIKCLKLMSTSNIQPTKKKDSPIHQHEHKR